MFKWLVCVSVCVWEWRIRWILKRSCCLSLILFGNPTGLNARHCSSVTVRYTWGTALDRHTNWFVCLHDCFISRSLNDRHLEVSVGLFYDGRGAEKQPRDKTVIKDMKRKVLISKLPIRWQKLTAKYLDKQWIISVIYQAEIPNIVWFSELTICCFY